MDVEVHLIKDSSAGEIRVGRAVLAFHWSFVEKSAQHDSARAKAMGLTTENVNELVHKAHTDRYRICKAVMLCHGYNSPEHKEVMRSVQQVYHYTKI